MMELTIYAVVLGVISLVTATPSGYNTKSGAVAGAHAAAGAYGGYGELPLSIPSAGGYSGSFSKSSSSSQASSSASASSSSFSFSGTGNIPNAIGSSGNVISGAGECSSGTCQSGIKGAPGHGSSGTGSSANAAAVAGADAFVGSTANSKPCTTGDCSNQNQRCSGSNCNYDFNKKKCTSGQCSPSDTAPTYFEDIPVNVGGSTTANTYNANEKPNHSTGSTSTTYGCSNGNCGSASTSKPVYSQTSAGAFPSSSGLVNKPATYLTSPKEEAPCTSPNCGTPTGGAYDTEHLPSSYTVPIQGSYTGSVSSPEKAPCSTGNCAPSSSYPSGSSATVDCVSGNCNKAPTISNSKDGIPDFLPLAPSASPNCGTPNCVTSPSAGSKYPNYVQQGSHSNTALSGSGSNLFSGSYGATKTNSVASSVAEKVPPYTGGFGGPPGILKPNEYTLPSKSPASDYKPSVPLGSYTPPTGSLLPHNQNSSPTGLHHKPTYNPTGPSAPQYQPSPSTGLNKPLCTSGNCGNTPTTPYPIYPPYAPTGSANGPSSCTFGNCGVQQLPSESLHKPGSNNPEPCTNGNCGTQPQQTVLGISTSTGSHVSTTCPSGNCGTKPTQSQNYGNIASGSSKPTLSGSSFPLSCPNGNCGPTQPSLSQGSTYEPSSSTGFNTQSTCTSGNCGTKPSQQLNYDNISSGTYKPTSPGSSFPSSCSNGNCVSTQPGLSQGRPYEPTSPTGSNKPSSCTSGNCGSQSSQSSNYGQAGTSTSTATGNYNNHGQNKPTYGFGGPPGVLKPIDFSTPTASLPNHNPTVPGSYNPTSCASGNCGSQSSNYGQAETSTSTATGSYNNHGQNKPTYGIGGTPAVLKPNDFSTATVSLSNHNPTVPGSYNPTSCTSGNCGSQSSQSSNYGQAGTSTSTATGSYNNHGQIKPTYGFGGPPGVLKPNDFSTPTASSPNLKPTVPGSNNPTSCTSGNCGSQSSNYGHAGTSTSTATGNYNNHGQSKPTHGFGGPPGVLKPNDFSTPTASSPNLKPTVPGYNNPTSCTSGNCGTQFGATAPSNNGQYNPTTSGSYNPSSCTYGNCGAQSGSSSSNNDQYKPTATGSYNPTVCSSGNCGHSPSQFGINSGTHSSGSAIASANAVAYTGGFGGPPGLLKPYDDGKLVGNGLASFGNAQAVSSQVGHFGNPTVTGISHSLYGKSLTDGSTVGAGSSAQAKAFGDGNYEKPDNGVSGCKGGCGSGGSGNYGLSGAAAKSQAIAGIGAYGFGGSFASSSASAHASAGAATKGGYGKR